MMHHTAKTYFKGLAKIAVTLDERFPPEYCRDLAAREKKRNELRERFRKKAHLLALLYAGITE